ncbi:AAA family ATPase [Frankia sp. R43]|uniref:AAA family ATPase n=1 Tax=Frankia sp. R43 TaxID=269536 RepID=UPI0009F9EC39|nr:LuxR family transcriptional regulator [Frankia sp. R43]
MGALLGLCCEGRQNRGVTRGIFSRERELTAVTRLLDGVADGPAVLAIWGEAGIGKTTVWDAGVAVAVARGFTVLACRAAAAEVRLSYAGLSDLLAEVGAGNLASLPGPQRRALDAALLRGADTEEDGPPAELRAVAAAFLSVLERLAGRAPVLVAVDDVQWLDESTRRAIAFAVRRCCGPVVTLTAGRDGDRDGDRADRRGEIRPRDQARLWHIDVAPLDLGALHHVLLENLGRSFPRPVMLRIAQASGGNPFYALELARSLEERGSALTGFPDSLRAVVRDRIGSLDPGVRQALLVVSALAVPRLDLVERVCGGVDAAESLGAAEDAGVVELSGGYARFTHPLLASGVYTEASPTTRRALHRQLSELVDDVEERARHLALAVTGPEAEAVRALDAAAGQARRRGAASAAAELLELAIGLGADETPRRVQAARDHLHAGDPVRARDLLEPAVDLLDPGAVRAEALALMATIFYQIDDYAQAVRTLRRAFDDAGDDPRLRAEIAVELQIALTNGGSVSDAQTYAVVAVQDAEQVGDDGLLAEALGASVFVRFLAGQGVDDVALARALALEDRNRRNHAMRWPALHAAMVHLWTRRVGEARAGLMAIRERCLQQGEEIGLWFLSFQAAAAALWSGDVETAQRLAVEVTDRALMIGTEHVRALALATQAQVAAWTGRVDEAQAAGEEAAVSLAKFGMLPGALFAQATLGTLALSVGDHSAAGRWLAPAATAMAEMGVCEPACVPFLPDAAEALIVLGRLDEAEPLADQLEASGRGPDQTWAEAVGARIRGLLAAARGDLDAARSDFERALVVHDRLPLPYDRARTLLLLGKLQRRRNERQAARVTLGEAVRAFDVVGARRWADNARAELDRLGSRPGPVDELTPTEERVAELAASGLINREVAAALTISPKTVEANLSRAYRKLGIRSRAQLGVWLAERRTKGQPPEA